MSLNDDEAKAMRVALYCQHPTVVKLQPKLKDRVVWLAKYSKLKTDRPFAPGSAEARALLKNPLVVQFDDPSSVVDLQRMGITKDEKHYELNCAWQRDCQGFVKYAPDEAKKAVQDAAASKAKEIEDLRKLAEAKKAAHDKAMALQKQQKAMLGNRSVAFPRRSKTAAAAAAPDSSIKTKDALIHNLLAVLEESLGSGKRPAPSGDNQDSGISGAVRKRLRLLAETAAANL